MAFLGAGDVKLLEDYGVRSSLKKANKGSQDLLEQALQRIGDRQTASSKASGRVRGQYAQQELGLAGDRASLGIEDQLAGLLAGGSYDELNKQKEHEQNLALAEEVGRLNKGGSTQELLAALGAAGQLGGTAYGIYNGRQRDTSRVPNANGSLPSSLSLLQGSGYGRYQ